MMFSKKKKERTFIITIEEEAAPIPGREYTSCVREKGGIFSYMTFWGSTREGVEQEARAFIERVKRGETHYHITV
jgi:hypothetical protein